MQLNSLHDLFVEQLQDLYSAETQLVQALPKLAGASSHEELRDAFEKHLAETREHVSRLEQILSQLGATPGGTECKAMKGLIAEGDEVLQMQGDPTVIDAALIAAAQRVEHYEIAAYGTARTLAQQLGHTDAAKLLNETLDEESAADEKLTKIAEKSVNKAAR
jgi:ferritin-like metal-binding protein YciE